MPLLRKEKKQDLLILTMDDPKSKNAFSPPMAEELANYISKETFKGLILTNSSSQFCSGGNLRFYKDLETKDDGLKHNQRISEILNQLDQLKVPTACFVNGACYGGGVELISSFDRVLCSPSSLFGLWQRRVGLTFGWGGQSRLERRLGAQMVNRWLLGGETIPSYEAKSRGLVDSIQLSSKGLETCIHWVEGVLRLGSENLDMILKEREDQEGVFQKLWLGKEHKEVLDKFK